MNILGLTILTPKGKAQLEAAAMAKAEASVGHIMKRYTTDRVCLRAAFAARHRLTESSVFETETVLETEGRAALGFINAVIRERGEA